jgi:protein-L-isoaspartate O-methyltransferase
MVLGLVIFGIVLLSICIVYMLQGPPYTASDDHSAQHMINAISKYHPHCVIDMGSGSGKLVILIAQHGYRVDGIELNPVLALWSKLRIRKLGLQDKATIRWGNFWDKDISNYDIVVLYAIQHVMPKLERKLSAELRPGSKIISNYFQFPERKPMRTIGRIRIYEL